MSHSNFSKKINKTFIIAKICHTEQLFLFIQHQWNSMLEILNANKLFSSSIDDCNDNFQRASKVKKTMRKIYPNLCKSIA